MYRKQRLWQGVRAPGGLGSWVALQQWVGRVDAGGRQGRCSQYIQGGLTTQSHVSMSSLWHGHVSLSRWRCIVTTVAWWYGPASLPEDPHPCRRLITQARIIPVVL